MTTTQKQPKKIKAPRTKSHRILLITAGVFLVLSGLAAALLTGAWWTLRTYATRMAPHMSIAGIDISGKTYQEATTLIQARIDTLNESGITVRYTTPDTTVVDLEITPEIVPLSASGDVQVLYTVELKDTIDAAYAVGHEKNAVDRLNSLIRSQIGSTQLSARLSTNPEAIADLLSTTFTEYETQPTDATIRIDEEGEIEIIPDVAGITFNYNAIVDSVTQRVSQLTPLVIDITPQETQANVRSGDLETQRVTVESYLSHTPVTLSFEDKTWEFSKAAVGSWLAADNAGVHVNPTLMDASFEDVHADIDQEAKEGHWELEKDAGGAPIGIHPLTPAQNGRSIDVVATAQAVTAVLAGNSDSPIAVITTEQLPQFSEASSEGLQIHDILGTGHSNMAGSPTNRRKNIARGVELLNGLLIPPGENFSLVQSIKPFTLENGYFPELVIKGNKTEPEIGGGLCQVGTTTFRAAMESGLAIVSRSNHAYAVSYYSDDRNHQPGTDATIYDPNPDFVFTNNTPGYILLQTRIEGNDLYFDFWGTSDGRDASFSAPRTYDWIAPPPTKEIPTKDLAPGERKCTESAHAGITAEFTYTIKKADGTQIDRVFTSKYKPWQAVCLVGESPETPE